MTTTWLCCDLPTAVADALERGTLANLAGAAPVDEADREAAYQLLVGVDHEIARELLLRLASAFDPYPSVADRQGART